MQEKQTNLCVAADITTKQDLLKLADDVGPEICVLKTHIDIISDFDEDLIIQLKGLANKHSFLIMEDRKFADIGSTMIEQYVKGIYHIIDWADLITVHAITGAESIGALARVMENKERAMILIAQLSSKENLIDEIYTMQVLEMAEKYQKHIAGFVAQKIDIDKKFIVMTPGINLQMKKDGAGQQYRGVEDALEQGADIIIVGRGIYQAENPRLAAQEYRKMGWHGYERKCDL